MRKRHLNTVNRREIGTPALSTRSLRDCLKPVDGACAALVLTLDTVPICNEMQQQAGCRAQAAPRAETGDNC